MGHRSKNKHVFLLGFTLLQVEIQATGNRRGEEQGAGVAEGHYQHDPKRLNHVRFRFVRKSPTAKL